MSEGGKKMTLFSTGEMAKLFDTTKYTIRHYLDKKILTFTKIDANGYYLFSERDIYRLYQIVILREIGIPIEEIKRILETDTIKEELIKTESILEDKITKLLATKSFIHQINVSQKTYEIDKITFLDYPDRYLSIVSSHSIHPDDDDYSKKEYIHLDKIYYIFPEGNYVDILIKSEMNKFDYHFHKGTYISKTFISNDEEDFRKQLILFLDDPLLVIKKNKMADLLIFENIDCSLAYRNHMLYTVEVKA